MKNKSRAVLTSIFVATFLLTIVAYSTPGDLDPTFSGDGKLTDWMGAAYGVAIQPDGKIVVVGGRARELGTADFQVARYNPDGTPDLTFGDGTGRVTTDFAGNYDFSVSVAIQPDGKIVVVGISENSIFVGGLALARYYPDGSLDTTFGGGSGKVLTLAPCWRSSRGFIADVVIQPNGKIVGSVGSTDYDEDCEAEGFLYRYHSDGSPDTSFAVVSTERLLLSVILQPADGRIVTSEWLTRIARFNSNGSPEAGFGSGGIVTLGPDFSLADSIAFDSDGKIAATGYHYSNSTFIPALFRFNSNGSPDPSFDVDGTVTIPSLHGLGSVVIQSDGKVLAAGTSGSYPNHNFALARYNPAGQLDHTFGAGGIRTLDFNNSNDSAAEAVFDSRGRAVVVGSSNGIFAIARFLGDSTPATSANISGRVTTPGGLGLRNGVVTMTGPDGLTRTATTSSFGNYTFADVPTGESYTLSVRSKRYRFTPRQVSPNGDLTDFDFVGME